MSKLQYNCHLSYIIQSVFISLKALHSCSGLISQIAFGKLVPRSCALSPAFYHSKKHRSDETTRNSIICFWYVWNCTVTTSQCVATERAWARVSGHFYFWRHLSSLLAGMNNSDEWIVAKSLSRAGVEAPFFQFHNCASGQGIASKLINNKSSSCTCWKLGKPGPACPPSLLCFHWLQWDYFSYLILKIKQQRKAVFQVSFGEPAVVRWVSAGHIYNSAPEYFS